MFSITSLSEEISDALRDHLKAIDTWGWDPFKTNDLSNNRSLQFTMFELWHTYDVSHQFQIPDTVLISFATSVEAGYQRVSKWRENTFWYINPWA